MPDHRSCSQALSQQHKSQKGARRSNSQAFPQQNRSLKGTRYGYRLAGRMPQGCGIRAPMEGFTATRRSAAYRAPGHRSRSENFTQQNRSQKGARYGDRLAGRMPQGCGIRAPREGFTATRRSAAYRAPGHRCRSQVFKQHHRSLKGVRYGDRLAGRMPQGCGIRAPREGFTATRRSAAYRAPDHRCRSQVFKQRHRSPKRARRSNSQVFKQQHRSLKGGDPAARFYGPGLSPATRITTLPKFFPSSIPINASGA